MGAYASAILISLAAVLLGRAVCVLAGNQGSTWLAAPVGFAALMIVCQVAVKLPGHGLTAVAAVAVLCAASLWIGHRRRAAWPPLLDALPVALVALIYLSLPFLANARVGVLGVSLLNDTRLHLLVAEGLRRPSLHTVGVAGPGYPIGPHAIAATFAQALGSDVDKTLTGVLIATPILTGLAALGLLSDISRPRRWLVAVLAAVTYLGAAWYIQSAFKEPIMALLLVGLVLLLQVGRRARFARPEAVAVPAGFLIAGVLYDYSYPGLIWPFAIVVCWLAAELTLGGAWRRLPSIGRGVWAAWPALVLGGGLLGLVVVPDISQIHAFWEANGGGSVGTVGGINTSALADLAGPLRSLEGLNIWLSSDFRVLPPDQLTAGLLAGLAGVVVVFAIVSALERGELVWPAAIVGLALVYVYVKHTQSPYVAAKALMVPAPLLAIGAGGALMRRLQAPDWRSFTSLGITAAAIVFFVFSFESSYLVLASGLVGPDNHIHELRSLRPLLHGRPTLVLFYDDYYQWELLGVPASSLVVSANDPTVRAVPISLSKPWLFGQALDFDSVNAGALDEFDYVITTRTDAQSQPPPNFRLVGSSASYEVFKREGPTPEHLVLPESGAPGAILDCRTPMGRRISHERGFAMVRAAPRYFPVSPLPPGGSERLALTLPAGEWQLSLPFTSSQAVTVRGPGLDAHLPPNLDRVGEIWPVGQIHSTGAAMTLTITMADPGLIPSQSQYFVPTQMIAVPPVPDRRIALRSACGRYVDWYTPN